MVEDPVLGPGRIAEAPVVGRGHGDRLVRRLALQALRALLPQPEIAVPPLHLGVHQRRRDRRQGSAPSLAMASARLSGSAFDPVPAAPCPLRKRAAIRWLCAAMAARCSAMSRSTASAAGGSSLIASHVRVGFAGAAAGRRLRMRLKGIEYMLLTSRTVLNAGGRGLPPTNQENAPCPRPSRRPTSLAGGAPCAR